MANFFLVKSNLIGGPFIFFKKRSNQLFRLIDKKPIISFLASLLVLIFLIAAGNFLFKPQVQTVNTAPQVKQIQLFRVSQLPKISTQAQVQNTGVVTITAQSSGVVQGINVIEGNHVAKNASLITLSSNYSGGNAPAIQQGIAAKQLQQINDTLPTQLEIIQKQKDLANLGQQNSDNLQNISSQSIVDQQAIAGLNQDMLNTVQQNLQNLENLPTDPNTAQQILNLKQVENQLQLSQNQTHQSLLNTQYQTNPTNPPTQITNSQRDVTLQQLDIQEKSLENSKQIAQLQVALAAINTSLLHPTAPFGATVEKVLVRSGESVNPGTPLLILKGDKQNVTAVAKVPQKVAGQISQIEDSILHIENSLVSIKPSFISDVATDGLLYSVIYTIPENFGSNLTDNDYLIVDIPIGTSAITSSVLFVPLDTIFQTQDSSYLYLDRDGVVVSQQVKTGQVIGSYVEVTNGLNTADQVILNRNVVEGDKVSASQ